MANLMESSKHSSMKIALSSQEDKACSEESGWTTYFDDFFSTENVESSYCASGFVGSSLVSDAASCVAWKLSNRIEFSSQSAKICEKLSFKKRRKGRVLDEDPLEDTASSPVNSPKVSELKDRLMNLRKKDDKIGSSQEKGIASLNYSQLQADESDELGFDKRNNDCTELKKKGLCLVPFSMLVNYHG